MTDLVDLIDPSTSEEMLADLLQEASDAGFPTTSWQSGSVPRTLLQIEAETLAGLSQTISEIAAGGYLDLATGDWLTLLARGVFGEERIAAVRTTGVATLTCSSAAGPYTIGARSIWVSDALGRRFTNTSAGTLPSSGTLSIDLEAEFAGAEYNVANGAIDRMVTPLPGVTVSNPDPGGGTWIDVSGADAESDELLRERCRDKWSTIGSGSTESAYEYWARQASAEVRRVVVRDHDNLGVDTDGHVTVILAGNSGTVKGGAVSAVAAYVDERRPVCDTVHVASADALPITVTGTLYVRAGYGTIALGEALDAIDALASELAIGETVYRAAIVEKAMLPAGVVNFVLLSPASDTVLAFDEVPTFTASISVVEVA